MKKIFLTIAAITFLIFFSNAQIIQWQKCLGGSGDEEARSIQQTNDGGYIIAGYSQSNDEDVTGNHGGYDYWVVKLDLFGNLQWQKSLGGTDNDYAYSIQQTDDGGYIVAGRTDSDDGDISGNHGYSDYWVVKLDVNGNIQWQKSLGGSDVETPYSIKQTTDDGYIIAGYSVSNDGDVSGNHGSMGDYWVVKLDTAGNIQWQKALGGSDQEIAYSIQQTTDGGYIVAGTTSSNDGDVTGYHLGRDYWIVKLDTIGNIQWQKALGGYAFDEAYSIHQTIEGGYIIAGYTASNDNDVSGNNGFYDYWIVKLDTNGIIQWQKALGGSEGDEAHSIEQTNDGGYIIAGYSGSNDSDVTENNGFVDYWIVKLDINGNIQWQKAFGGSSNEFAYSGKQTTDGGYILAGCSASNDGDVFGNHGNWDYWLVKFIKPNITGVAYNDFNANGIKDSLEQGVSMHIIRLEPGPFYTTTNNDGYYCFSENNGIYHITYISQQYWSVTSDSLSYTITLSDSANMADSLDFGVKAKENTQDVGIYLTGSLTRIFFPTYYWINYKNWGTLDMSGTIYDTYDTLLTYINSIPSENNLTSNILEWNYDTLANNEQRIISSYFQVPGIQYLGDTLITFCHINPLAGDTNITDNYDTLIQVITGSYDPNDKLVAPAGKGIEGYVLHGQKLIYTVRFQNTGTDTAFFVRITDTIDSDMDIESFTLLASSHPVTYMIEGTGIITFAFNNIMLPDSNVNYPASMGFVKYNVKPKTGLPDYTQVKNKAFIYFDYNPAVVTNEVLNTYVSTIPVGITESIYQDNNMNIYPNPASDKIFIVTQKEFKNTSFEIFDIKGQLLMQQKIQNLKTSIDIRALPEGLYFIKMMDDKEVTIEKFVKN